MKDFADSVPVCWALAAQALGWRPNEFWAATPSELTGAILPPQPQVGGLAPNRDLIAQLMERDANG
ncbi:phage tail assembly chaperone [Erythrobacter aurantius]|uniref:phage tail assembly chaperone n=1 Tax=Erythrobacter aurantius TaxID=2909249 RepID=UPI00207A2707|nr:phage tail assembly chaperone [Erythrobacter aurantius]